MRLSINWATPALASVSIVALLVMLSAGACSGRDALPEVAVLQRATMPKLSVVTTSNIVAEWAQRVGGNRVEVFSLLPVGADPHSFRPGARDVARVADAELVLTVGLGLEATWLKELVSNAAAQAERVVALGEVVESLEVAAGTGPNNGDSAPGPDPHFWFDPVRVQTAVSHIAELLSALDPHLRKPYRSNAEAYNQELDELDGWIRQRLDEIPIDRRLLVTTHDSFRYLADRYGLTVVGAVFPDFTTERQPSPAELAELATLMRESRAPALILESTLNDRLSRALARETGATVVDGLHTGSLGGPGSGAETYVAMMRANIQEVVGALR